MESFNSSAKKQNYLVYKFLAAKVIKGDFEDFDDVVDFISDLLVMDCLEHYRINIDSNAKRAFYNILYKWLSKKIWGQRYSPGSKPLFAEKVIQEDEHSIEYLASLMARRSHSVVLDFLNKNKYKKDQTVQSARYGLELQKIDLEAISEDKNIFYTDRECDLENKVIKQKTIKEIEDVVGSGIEEFLKEVQKIVVYLDQEKGEMNEHVSTTQSQTSREKEGFVYSNSSRE